MNGEMLKELRDILAKEENIPQKVVTRLTLSSLAELGERMSQMGTLLEDHLRSSEPTEITDKLDDMSKSIGDVNSKLTGVETNITILLNNPAVKVGAFFNGKPKVFLATLILTVLLVDIFGRILLPWLGVPREIIEIVATPIPTVIP